jgi:hypothetical protein
MYATLSQRKDGDLLVDWNLEKIKEDKMLWTLYEMTYLDFWATVLGNDLCNGYSVIIPEDIGALADACPLTSAFIISDGQAIWWDSNHQIRHPWEDMYINESCILFKVDGLHPLI